jgi:hypothetical protein
MFQTLFTVTIICIFTPPIINYFTKPNNDNNDNRKRKVRFGKNEIRYYNLSQEEKNMKKQALRDIEKNYKRVKKNTTCNFM